MKNAAVIVFTLVCVVTASLADAAPKKRRQNRQGPYVALHVGMTRYASASPDEQRLADIIDDPSIPAENVVIGSDTSDVGYALAFGYRINRWAAVEVGLAQWGKLTSTATANLDLPGDNQGFLPAKVQFGFKVGGAVFTGKGIWPINDYFELYGRVGILFASTTRDYLQQIGTGNTISGSIKGNSQNLVLGAGAHYNINAMYTMTFDYERINGVGDSTLTGTEDFSQLSLGLIVRF
jgi:opacity protein-like surface antigen